MTHTSHRRGDRASLEGDYVILSRMEEYSQDVQERTKTLVKICAKHNTVGMRIFDKNGRSIRHMKGWEKKQDSGIWFSHTLEEILKVAEEPVRFSHAVYTNKEDVRKVIGPVLRHRIVPNFNAEADGVSTIQIVERLLQAG